VPNDWKIANTVNREVGKYRLGSLIEVSGKIT